MSKWNCCRTCLSVVSLNPIFSQTEHSEYYTKVIFAASGIKVEMDDRLPKQMCLSCVNFINEVIKFRKICTLTQQTLQEKLTNGTYEIKEESPCNNINSAFLDISDYLDDDFKDYDDNVSLNTLQFCADKSELDIAKVETTNIDNNSTVQENSKAQDDVKPDKVITDKNVVKAKVKNRRTKKKQEDSEKAKEEIECEVCHKILTSKLSIRNHYKIHTGFDVVCEHCGKKFITRRLLLMHCRAKHGYEKTDKCSYCDYKASNAEQVKIHERLHTGEKPFACGECGARFHRRSSYLQHVPTHLPDKTVPCAQCGARFKSATLMRIHCARHRAPRYSYSCALCHHGFARRRNVARHVQRIHCLPPEPHTICRRKIA